MADLKIEGLTKRFGGIVALNDVSLEVHEGEIVGLIGPNGAGKTTVFNCVSRFYDPDAGSIRFGDVDLLKLPPHGIILAGIGRTFQHAELFRTMTVLENLMVGQQARSGRRIGPFAFPFTTVGEQRQLMRRANEIIDFLGLGDYRNAVAQSLPFGIQKRVDVARALVSGPRLVLLDEPASGLGHEELQALAETIRGIRSDLKVTVLLVEHHMSLVMEVSDRVTVLDFGKRIADGSPDEVRQNPEVIEAYLGTEEDAQT